MRPCNEVIRKIFDLVDRMEAIADEGDMAREDVGCGILYGVLRDAAYKVRKMAEKEREAHIRKGWWEHGSPPEGFPKSSAGIADGSFES